MRIVLLVLSVFFFSSVFSQDNDKPSWYQQVPEKNDAPDMDIDSDMDMDLDLDLGIERDNMTNQDEENKKQKEDKQKRLAEEAEKERLAKEAEEKRLADEAEQKRLAEEAEKQRLAQEAEEKRIAEEAARQAELEKIAEEKRRAEEQAEEDVTDSDPEITAEPEIQATADYSWQKIKNVLPRYPSRAVRSQIEGWVDVLLTINADGDVISTESVGTLRNQKIFIKSALDAVNQWKFEPPRNYGITDTLTTEVRIVFEL